MLLVALYVRATRVVCAIKACTSICCAAAFAGSLWGEYMQRFMFNVFSAFPTGTYSGWYGSVALAFSQLWYELLRWQQALLQSLEMSKGVSMY